MDGDRDRDRDGDGDGDETGTRTGMEMSRISVTVHHSVGSGGSCERLHERDGDGESTIISLCLLSVFSLSFDFFSFVSLLLPVILSQFEIILNSLAPLPISKDLESSPEIICKIHAISVLGASIFNE